MTAPLPYPNLCAMHRAATERFGPRAALRYRHHGMDRDVTWEHYRLTADRAALGLMQLGINPGDRVAMLSENRFEWLIADHAILSAGAVNVPLHAPLAPAQVRFQLSDSGARAVIVSGPHQAEKIRQAAPNLPDLKHVIAFDPIPPGDTPSVSWQGLVHRGAKAAQQHTAELSSREQSITPQNLATLIYTSGTTGNPKGVMLTHGNLLSNAAATLDRLGLDETDTLLSWLPYSHIYARTVDHFTTTLGGLTVVLGGPVEMLTDDLRRVQPTWLTSVPRFYEKVWAGVQPLPAKARKQRLRETFPRIKQLSSGGAPLPRSIAQGFCDAGVPLIEGYGLTESSPVISFNSRDDYRIGSVGKPLADVQVRIAADGEILTRGPHVMKGYWNNPQATAETIVNGWLLTGDVGTLDADGYLSITDRKKDIIITSGGKNIAPAELERLLAADPHIDQAVVYGDGRPFVCALLVPNPAQLEMVSRALGSDMPSGEGFVEDAAILNFFRQRVEAAMENVSQPERVKKFLVLKRPLSVEDGELTATLKVRRRHILARYEPQLGALYAEPHKKAPLSATPASTP